MKPFNLERALAGDKVITRDGREVTQITKFDIDIEECIYGVIEKCVYSFDESGRFDFCDSEMDLFMWSKMVKHKRWINLYDNGDIVVYETEREASSEALNNDECVQSKLVEWGSRRIANN